MPKIAYVNRKFAARTLSTIERADAICREYAALGFSLTLRQLFYQFVARGLIPNSQQEYKKLGDVVNNARLAGLLDWNWLEDRTRNVRELAHWESPTEIMRAVASQYRFDKWEDQDRRPVVMIEKDALVGVIQNVCEANDVAYFSCRGYTSQSEMWSMARRLLGHIEDGQTPVILHLGDHDPSGIDMTRDIADRLGLFLGGRVDIRRLALNMDQVEEWNPPPNPAKDTDARFIGYMRLYGEESWELDALDPTTLSGLVGTAISAIRDPDRWDAANRREEEERRRLLRVASNWSKVAAYAERLKA